jgi:uncharacterized protein YdaT
MAESEELSTKRARLDALREPTRSKARELLDRLLRDGRPEAEALDAALAGAEEWERSRVPNVAPGG